MKNTVKVLLCIVLLLSALLCLFSCNKQNADLTTDADFDLLQNVIRFVEENYYDSFNKDLADVYAAYGIIESLGKYNYIYPDAYTASGDGSGFGLLVKISFYNEIFIDWILPGSPFENESEGVQPQRGDEIYAINGKRVSGADSSYFQALVQEIKVGEDTSFTIRRGGEMLSCVYQKIKVKFPDCFYVNDLPGVPSDFGYICLRTFDSTDAATQFKQAVSSYQKDGNKALILDLRGNGGGHGSVLTEVAKYLLGAEQDEKFYNDKQRRYEVPIVEVHFEKTGEVQTYKANVDPASAITDPIYVLADGSTASASEALIGSMRAHGTLTKLIGKPTVGKGVAQNGFSTYSPTENGYLYDYFKTDDGSTDRSGYLVQVVVGQYYIFDDSAEDGSGKYCMNGKPFEPDEGYLIEGENPITTSFAEDLFIAAAMRHYSSEIK